MPTRLRCSISPPPSRRVPGRQRIYAPTSRSRSMPSVSRSWVMFRHPAKLAAFNLRNSGMTHAVEACGDSDDLFVDTKRSLIYISCGEGFLDVFAAHTDDFVRVTHLATAAGARTSLWVPQFDRLFLAVRAAKDPAAIWIFRPSN